MTTLCFFRFWLRIGIGGDYPLSATIMSEYANKRTRGAFMAAVFAMQGFGILLSSLVSLIVAAAFDHSYKAPAYKDNAAASLVPQADYVWRIILMFGALPAALTYYWRMKMPETARYTALIAKNAKQAAEDMAKVLQVDIEAEPEKVEKMTQRKDKYGLFSWEFALRHGLHLLGTTTTWFLLDIEYYSNNLFQKDIYTKVGWLPQPEEMNAIYEVYRVAGATTLITLCATVPGYWFTVAFIDYLGRLFIQLMGFFFMSVFMFALAFRYNHWNKEENQKGFLVMYSLTFFFANFGPNSTTFIFPAEIFPARLRSTCHGISAAAGKAGATIGVLGFLFVAQSKKALLILGGINLVGVLYTFLLPEPKGKSLEELSGENKDDAERGDQAT
ncbi:hypothetical protein K1719_012165 [Acacia pycnantha]|nr:hypothetical protein K1719_012165 [Acacia pycnantha]